MLKPVNLFLILLFLSFTLPLSSYSQDSGLEASIQQLAVDIAGQMKQRNIQKIAIDDFTDLNCYMSALGDFISEELVTNFYTQSLGNFDVVERRELARVIKEQKLGSTGLLDKRTIAQIGKILGVEAIVTGSIAYLGNTVKINARMIGVANAKIFAAASRKIRKDNVVEELINQGARPSVSPSISSGIQVQRFDTYFQNSFLRVEPKMIHVNNGDEYTILTLSLLFRNLSKDTIYLSFTWDGPVEINAALLSSQGEFIRDPEVVGMTNTSSRHPSYKEFTSIEKETQTVVNLSYKIKGRINGKIFSFSAKMFRLLKTGRKFSRFSIGIPNIVSK